MNFGNAIASLRKWRGLSQSELGERIGKTCTSVSLMETGRKFPNTKSVKTISEALDVPTSVLLLYSLTKEDIPDDKKILYDALVVPLRDALMDENESGKPLLLKAKNVMERELIKGI